MQLDSSRPHHANPSPSADIASEICDQEADRKSAFLCCHACRERITRPQAACDIHHAHEHRRVNPQGVPYVIGCFQNATHLVLVGPPTEHWSWFPGYAWQIAHCARCGQHLGWRFSGPEHFYGLIRNRLILEDESAM